MKIRTHIALNVDGVTIPSGQIVDLDDATAEVYVSQGFAIRINDAKPIETATALEAPETADAPRARTRTVKPKAVKVEAG